MRFRPAILVPVLALSLGVASFAHAGMESPEARGQWIPSLSAEGGARVVESQATVSSPRGDFDGDNRALFGYLGFGLQLMTPAWFDLPASPRIFVRAGVATSLDGEARIANDGGPGEIVIPILDNNNDGIPDGLTPVAAVKGQGSTTAARSEPMLVTAALGIDLSMTVLERRVHVKPSFEWIMQEDRIVGSVGFVESLTMGSDECPCRTGFASGETTETFHSLGMGLEIEAEAGRMGPVLVGVYAGGQAYYALDRKVEVTGSGQFSDGSGSLTVNSTYEREEWDYRAGVGVRFHWLPE